MIPLRCLCTWYGNMSKKPNSLRPDQSEPHVSHSRLVSCRPSCLLAFGSCSEKSWRRLQQAHRSPCALTSSDHLFHVPCFCVDLTARADAYTPAAGKERQAMGSSTLAGDRAGTMAGLVKRFREAPPLPREQRPTLAAASAGPGRRSGSCTYQQGYVKHS